MELALWEARAAGERQEVPIGAVLVLDGRVIARSGNRTRELNDVTAHAEIAVIRMACEALGQERLPGAAMLPWSSAPCARRHFHLPVSVGSIMARKPLRAVLWRVACGSSASRHAIMRRMFIRDWRRVKVLTSCGNFSAGNVSTTERLAGGVSLPASHQPFAITGRGSTSSCRCRPLPLLSCGAFPFSAPARRDRSADPAERCDIRPADR